MGQSASPQSVPVHVRRRAHDRPLDDKHHYSACYAPHTALYFDQHGDVRACCQNMTGAVGNVWLQSIREIWDGAAAKRLRRALEVDDHSLGCAHCDWQDGENGADVRFSRSYDGNPVGVRDPEWPVQMEFAMSNACNLQCVMCTGWNSSAIRAHRERLPPLPKAYGEKFFAELAEFLPHLRRVIVLGGEPFLAAESLRLLDMLAEMERPPSVCVITNGTQWSPRIERIFERLPIEVNLSLDAVSPDAFARIRVGATLDHVLEVAERYRRYTSRHGTRFGLSFCLMESNWQEFAAVLAFAEERDYDYVQVNIVTDPREHSLYRLGADELARVVQAMDAAGAAGPAKDLGRFRPVWDQHLAALRSRSQQLDDEGFAAVPGSEPWDDGGSELVGQCREHLRRWSSAEPVLLHADPSQRITDVEGPSVACIGVEAEALRGRPLPVVLEIIGGATGAHFSPAASGSGLPNEVSFVGIADGRVKLELRCFLFHDESALHILVARRP